MTRTRTLLTLTPLVLALAACSQAAAAPVAHPATTAPAPTTASSAPAPSVTASTTVRPAAVAPQVLPPLYPPAGTGLQWVGTTASPGIKLATVSGGAARLMWMDSRRLVFRFIPGYEVPVSGGPSVPADNRPSSWVPTMVAAFNGGFQLRDDQGGYWYRGHSVKSLRAGFASMVLYSNGTMKVCVWGRVDCKMSSTVVAVRQNMVPLVDRGVSKASPNDYASQWGAADGGASRAKRAAVGYRGDGSIVFEYGDTVTGYQMAVNMVKAGVKTAMVLDMNKTWPTGFVYTHRSTGISGQRIHPAIMRDPSTYYSRFKKDFVVVLKH